MTNRRGGRPSQVRPRPPSTGRPSQPKVRPRSTASGRLPQQRRAERRTTLPIGARVLLVVSIVALVGAVGLAGAGILPRAVAGIGSALASFIETAQPATPAPTIAPVPDPPALVAPEEPYTNSATIDVTGTIPSDIAGKPGYVIRLLVARPDVPTEVATDVATGVASAFTIPGIELTVGRNDFSATLVGPGGESEPSAIVTYLLDQEPPAVAISSPKDGALVNGPTVKIAGKTQARSAIVARNEATGGTDQATAAEDGTFTIQLPIAPGTNGISIASTDPAGNAGSTVLTIRRGSGKLTAALEATAYRVSVKRLPSRITLSATVTDPDGRPLEGAAVTFTLSVPGIPTIAKDATTTGDGTATFQTSIPKGADPGNGIATILVTTDEFGATDARVVIVFIK